MNLERRRPRLHSVVASTRSCPESPSRAAEGTSTPPREARVGGPGGCATWFLKGLQGTFDRASQTSRTDAAKTPQVWSEARTSGEADSRAEPPASGAER